MPHEISFVENDGTLAHYKMLQKIHDLCNANGWDVLRYDTGITNRELILKAPGLSGTEEIFVGFRCYHNAGLDYYNMTVAGFTGYVSGNSFDTQPGVLMSGIPTHNNRIDYWMTLNGQRIAIGMKVGTPVYESCYAGKMLPYASPSQYPYPLVIGGMLTGEAATRFSDSAHSIPYKGNKTSFRLRFNDGTWKQPESYPWNNSRLARVGSNTSESELRDTNGKYSLLPVILMDASNVYGELDGIFYISGFNNAVENTLTIGGVTYVVMQDVNRTGFIDYYAIRMDS